MRIIAGPAVMLAAAVAAQTAEVAMETVEYKGWKNNLKLSNQKMELIVTLDIGPRVIFLGPVGGENVFKNYDAQMGKCGEKEWQIRGGHRLWLAPEGMPFSYFPDNTPVATKKLGPNSVRFIPAPETPNGIQKEMDITLDAASNHVTVVHRLKNIGKKKVHVAPWALTVMAPGGMEIIPLPAKKSHDEELQPNQFMTIWAYTDFADPRWHWGTRYFTLSQDPQKGPTKIGLAHQEKWLGYLRNGLLFVKVLDYKRGAAYPDNGCNFETFTNQDMLEAESLGPVGDLAPGKAVEHVEQWYLFCGVSPEASGDEAAIDRHVRPLVERIK
jgi:hypothetical protein